MAKKKIPTEAGFYYVKLREVGGWTIEELFEDSNWSFEFEGFSVDDIVAVGEKIPTQKELMKIRTGKKDNELIEKVLSLYVPDGNPKNWRDKILALVKK